MNPGMHFDIPAAIYHTDPCPVPSLSSSIAKVICEQSPIHARNKHPQLNPMAPTETKDAFDIGTAAHALLLEGESVAELLDFPDYRTKAAQQARDEARQSGKVPILKKKWRYIEEMVESARKQIAEHDASDMFRNGTPETTLIWQEGDVWCRARLDWLASSNLFIDDYKTTDNSASPYSFSRSLFSLGYDVQAAFYLRGLRKLTGIEATFRFCVQEVKPPYALSVVSLSPEALVIGEKKVLFALEIWKRCLDRDEWPGYTKQVCYAELPPYEETRWIEKEVRELT